MNTEQLTIWEEVRKQNKNPCEEDNRTREHVQKGIWNNADQTMGKESRQNVRPELGAGGGRSREKREYERIGNQFGGQHWARLLTRCLDIRPDVHQTMRMRKRESRKKSIDPMVGPWTGQDLDKQVSMLGKKRNFLQGRKNHSPSYRAPGCCPHRAGPGPGL